MSHPWPVTVSFPIENSKTSRLAHASQYQATKKIPGILFFGNCLQMMSPGGPHPGAQVDPAGT